MMQILDKMEAAGLTKAVVHHKTFQFQFPDCEKLPPPVLPFQNVSFAYSGKASDYLYKVSGRERSTVLLGARLMSLYSLGVLLLQCARCYVQL